MKKITQPNHLVIAILGFILIQSTNINAQVLDQFASRYTESIRGDITMIANNMISRDAVVDYNGLEDNHDFSNNIYVDIDNDNTTFNSSNATFNNPNPLLNCITIRKVLLYWAAADKETNSNDNRPNWNFNDVKLMLPGEGSYTTYTADEVIYRGRDTHFSNDPYVCVKDITNEVLNLNSPYGTYQVANVEGKIGGLMEHQPGGNAGTSGGWQIVYVYSSPDLNMKNISIFDGYAHVTSSNNNFDINFNGFQTTPNGPVNTRIAIGSLEGDRVLDGDKLQILDTSNNFIDLNTTLRNSDNFFNSRITIDNNDFIDRVPASTNTLGFDAAVFNLDNSGNSIIGNNQTSATIRLTSNQETYGLYMLGLSVDVWAPSLYPIRLDSDATNNLVQADDNVTFDFNFSNTGNDDAVNVVLHTTLPNNLEFVAANNLPNGVTYAYNINTRLLQFFVEDGLVDIGDPEISIEFDVQIKDECYFLEQSCDLNFELQITATYNGINNPEPQTTLSSSDLDICHLGNVLPITITQPDAAIWANSPGDLDRTVDCTNINDLSDAQSLFPTTDKCTFNLIKTSGPFVPGNGCGDSGSYTNTWTFTDACGRTIADYVQVITVVNNSGPVFDMLPPDSTINCSETPNFAQPTFTNSCSNSITLTYNDTNISGACDGDYSINRTWTATDECGYTSTASQTINIIDTTAPILITAYNPELSISCELPPDPPSLEFTDNCSSNIEVLFYEQVIEIDFNNFDIVRTWEVYDDCANVNTYNQVIHMETVKSTASTELNLCANDNQVDLNNYVPAGSNGYWEVTNVNLLNNTILDPSILNEGTYTFNYIMNNNQCVEVMEVIANITGDCEETNKCIRSTFDVDISKLVTPNGDLKNQTFEVAYVLNPNKNQSDCDIIVKVKMFNRWGTRVFESTNYDNNWIGTTGGVGAAELLPAGTYYYVVTLENSGLKPIQGYILLGTEQ
ncbi:gliding motility-associated C-terminal domain-containing protein [Pontimicrobium aquaticum]|uniref:Gliding motility-associated C-terminal domain-containing protein n=1 Tax=Pontimicrobium aquaticum TaxID=2565367 RepID=A0A4U0EQV4_9FLAO|nr:gliding motility-associated C-terminal domain-containing protein [Pontimicrobium aquaticum]TJY34021.1 gliding motility-associated C-terminal domain-containing protein [Pontimicrobium aquaticum]